MTKAIIGRKVGMTRVYDPEGRNIPVTLIEAGPCYVSQIKTRETDGYSAVQLAYEDVKPRNTTIPVIGHDMKAGVSPKRVHREVRVKDDAELADVELGGRITVEAMESVRFVDIVGTSKGKGTAGVMKRWNFKGMSASHGTERKHRHPGSICGRSSNRGTGKPKRGIRMGGRMGNERVTLRSLEVIGQDKEQNLLWVKGPVPGPRQGLLLIREATRLYKRKAAKAK
ncbi:MAG: 50S ribosomal protein L3 [Phycisphaeraceae bacterium]|nr:50S ribosomal protein L3 [Phycisphaeraceae bacterium]